MLQSITVRQQLRVYEAITSFIFLSSMSNRCFNMTWSPEFQQIGRAYLGLAVPAFLANVCFWIQVTTHGTLRQMSMLWIYNYLFTDMVLLVQFFLEYTVRYAMPYCISPSTFYLLCNIEAYTAAYMTILEAYMLVCLNVTRYYLIVKNVNVSARYPNGILLLNVFLYVFGIVFIVLEVEVFRIVQVHPHESSPSCHLQHFDIKTQIGNLTLLLLVPIILNCYFMVLTTTHVRQSQLAARSRVRRKMRAHAIHLQNMYALLRLFISRAANICICWFNFSSSTSCGYCCGHPM